MPPPLGRRQTFEIDRDAGLFAALVVGTKLYTAPQSDASAWVFHGQHERVVKLIERGEEFVEVQLDWEPRDSALHCLLEPAADLGLRVFVRESDLADLTSSAQQIDLGERHGINVASGVRVIVTPGGEAVLRARATVLSPNHRNKRDYLEVGVDLDMVAIGKFYTPISSASAPTPTDEDLRGWTIEYGDRRLTATGRSNLYAKTGEGNGEVLVGVACLQVAGVHADIAGQAIASGGGGCARMGVTARQWTIAADVSLSWPSGEPAGQTYSEVTITTPLESVGDKSCFAPDLTCQPAEELRVCVASSELIPQRQD